VAPGEFCWRPVDAKGFMFIHCIFTGFKKEYKNNGYGARLIDECINDAQKENMSGVAVVTRKGSFMAGKDIFVKKGFEVADKALPDFELLVKRFNEDSPYPKFKSNLDEKVLEYGTGLTIIRASQCPYTVKNVNEIVETSRKKYGIEPNVIELKDCYEAQNSPCPFGSFCIIYDGKILAHHPISNGRFMNIMNKVKS